MRLVSILVNINAAEICGNNLGLIMRIVINEGLSCWVMDLPISNEEERHRPMNRDRLFLVKIRLSNLSGGASVTISKCFHLFRLIKFMVKVKKLK